MNFFKKIFKSLAVAIVFALLFTGGGFGDLAVNAQSIEIDDAFELRQSEEFQQKEQLLSQAITIENGDFKLDKKIVQGNLSALEISQVEQFLKNTNPDVIKTIESDLNGDNEFGTYALPAVVVAFLATLAIFVGWELATQITQDFYNWGVTSACKKWKNVSVVKSFCTANNYL